MASSQVKHRASRRTRKIAAIAAGILVVGVGATYTLASWTDSEWVWGGASGVNEPGVGTGYFEVEQSTDGTTWSDQESNPGGALNFTAAALALSPGDAVYAPVSLRTKVNSVAGDVTLQAAVPAVGVTVADADGSLWDAVEVAVYTSAAATAPSCLAASFNSADWTAVAGVTSLDEVATATQSLGAATTTVAGAPQHYCFVLTLSGTADDTLMNRTIAPAWEFRAISL